jgi:hypothetical protein
MYHAISFFLLSIFSVNPGRLVLLAVTICCNLFKSVSSAEKCVSNLE